MKQPIVITAVAPAPIETTWARYTQPEHITQWNFASQDWCCPWATTDLRQGGKYVARMEAKDGSMGFDLEAIYTHIDPPTLLASTLTDGRKVEVRLDPEGPHTRVTIAFEAENQNSRELQEQGWQAILDQFVQYAAVR
jgi:uncharacterized protein YndB with AHSA1/START domain